MFAAEEPDTHPAQGAEDSPESSFPLSLAHSSFGSRNLASKADEPSLDLLQKSLALCDLAPDSQRVVTELFTFAGPRGKRKLIALVERRMDLTGENALHDRDFNGVSLLQNLQLLVSSEIHPEFIRNGIGKRTLLLSLLEEIADPREVNQDLHGTCTATSMQYILCNAHPGEYTRLIRGLLSRAGSVQMKNGDPLVAAPDSFARDYSEDRSDTERVFQAAVMEFAVPECAYSNVKDKHYCASGRGPHGKEFDGLDVHQAEHALQALFGRDFRAFSLEDASKREKSEVLELIRLALPELAYAHIDIPGGAHAVVIYQIDDERVYIRDPRAADLSFEARKSGILGWLFGMTEKAPPYRIEDLSAGKVSFLIPGFLKILEGALVPL